MSKINKRLQILIDLLPSDIVLADIGTDHGYLPIESVKQNKSRIAYAADINQAPLNQAIKNIEVAKLNNVVIPVLSNGLTYFNEHEIFIDWVVISGLGSSTIKEILQLDSKLFQNYLVCSNTDPLILRQLIKKNHWFINEEKFFLDNNRKYWLIKISKKTGKKIRTRKDLFVGVDQQLFKNELYIDYLKKLYTQNEEILKVSQNRTKNKELKRYNRQILKVIKSWN